MTELFQIAVLRVGVSLLAALAVVSVLVGLFYAGRCMARQLKTLALVVMSFVAIVATVLAQKDRTGGTGTTGVPSVGEQQTGTTGIPPVGDGLTDSLRFAAIDVHADGTATLAVAWPTNIVPANTTIDILAATSLVNSVWTWQCCHTVAEGETNWNVTVTLPETAPGTNAPSAFYRALHRETCADTMDDLDGDGIPGAYEIRHGTNPYVADAGNVPRLTVGDGWQYATLEAALAESDEYSVIAVTSGVYQVSRGIQMPSHPVMVTCEDGYAVFSGATPTGMFMLGEGHESGHTLFRNLYLNLTSASGMQAGFWCGGGMPWQGPGAAAVFENVHVRAPNPDVEYFGWLFYGRCDAPAVIRGCCVNASGAEWIYAIFGDNPPPIVVDSCTFVNFPIQGVYQSTAIGLRSTLSNGTIPATPPVAVSRVLFDASFTNAWPMARFENAADFHVTMTDCIRPSEPASPDFAPDVADNVHIATSQVTWAGFPLPGSPEDVLEIGAFTPIPPSSPDDSDRDGLTDYDEAYGHGTDPFNADSDNDGVSDNDEISEGTDPADPHSFKQRLTVSVTNTASLAHAVYAAWGFSPTGWETNGLATFPQGFGDTVYTNASSHGATHVKSFCDLNGNGEYDAACDILLVRPIPTEAAAQVKFSFGDVDGDGATDAQERVDGTDPYDDGNFRLVATVNVESSDVAPGLTNYVACGHVSAGWETTGLATFTGSALAFPIDCVATNGEIFAKVFRDFNANGIYDEGVDALVSRRLTKADNGKTVTFRIGDSDGDGISDSVEMDMGTDQLDRLNYCFNLSLTYTDVFRTTNALTFAASFGTNRVYGPYTAEGRTWSHDFGHCIATNGEKVSVSMWDDANQNGEWDVGETSNRYVIAVSGHDMAVTNALPYGNFDRDGNEIPDWWEARTGLDAESVARCAYDDPDGDGLVNLHEYWCDTDPLVPDGSNTLLSVASRSIDDRIRDVDPTIAIPRFVNYFPNGSNGVFQLNTNFWARDLDLSCVSVWNNGDYPGTQAATLITRKHVVLAHHWVNDKNGYIFCDTNGQVYARTLVGSERIADDLRLGRLNEPLPDSFKPANVPSTNIISYLATGKYLPTLCINQEKGASVAELIAWDGEITDNRGIHYRHYGCTSQTNLVSVQRCNVRGATVDGNSGCPIFVVAGDELVLLFSKHLGQKGGETWKRYWGPVLPFRLEAIQRKINQWEGENANMYQIVPFDFSSFGEIVNQR